MTKLPWLCICITIFITIYGIDGYTTTHYNASVSILAFSVIVFLAFRFSIISSQLLPVMNFKSLSMSSSHLFFSLPNLIFAVDFILYTFVFLAILGSFILFMWLNHPILDDLIWFIIFYLSISLSRDAIIHFSWSKDF